MIQNHQIISIHTPRVGRDISAWGSWQDSIKFQSTRPVWGVTMADNANKMGSSMISIHTPRVGRDVTGVVLALMS